jgi:hypothetical protein
MNKKFYDIIPKEKRSIRNIPLNKKDTSPHKDVSVDGMKVHSTRTHTVDPDPAFLSNEDIDLKDTSFDEQYLDGSGTGKHRWVIVSFLAILLMVTIALLSTTFASATVRVNPITQEVVLEDTRVYLKDVDHRVVDIETDIEETLEASGLVNVTRKSTGTIVLYNNFNSANQRLVANTRLETPGGLIFYLKNPVTIPGRKTVNGKVVPGSVEATIEASLPGEKYNVGLTDFKLVAYKGTGRYDTIYGRSKTPTSNGFQGQVPNIPSSQIASSTNALREKVKNDLLNKAKETIKKSDNEVIVNDGFMVEYEPIKQVVSKDGKSVTVSQKAKGRFIVFKKDSISNYIINHQSKVLDNESAMNASSSSEIESEKAIVSGEIIYTGDISKLKFRLPSDTVLDDLSRDTAYMVSSGTTTMTSMVDIYKVSRAISGLTREQAIPAIKRLVDLESVEVSISPWWRSKLPRADNIKIEIEN